VQREAPVALVPNAKFQGVLMWKGDPSGTGVYSNEVKLTPANVNVGQFGRLGSFQADGLVMGQPLYVSELDVAAVGTRNVIILATEHDSVYAIDADNPGSGPLWERRYVDAANGIMPMPDSFWGTDYTGRRSRNHGDSVHRWPDGSGLFRNDNRSEWDARAVAAGARYPHW